MLSIAIISSLLIGASLAEEKWVWSKSAHSPEDRLDQNFRYENLRIDEEYDRQRQREREPTTRRPDYASPFAQQQQQVDDYGDYDVDDPRLYDRYGNNPAPVTDGLNENSYPNAQNGILVGPGGPTGLIGRPQSAHLDRYPAALNSLKQNAANGILVGPGGPTGIIGRPTPFTGNGLLPGQNGLQSVGPVLFPNANAGNQNGIGSAGQGFSNSQLFKPIGAGFQPGVPGAQGIYPGGQYGALPTNIFSAGLGGIYNGGQGNIYPGGQGSIYPGGQGIYPGGQGGIYPGGQGSIYQGGQGSIYPGGQGGVYQNIGEIFPGNKPGLYPGAANPGSYPGAQQGYGLYIGQSFPGIPYSTGSQATAFDEIDDIKFRKGTLKSTSEKNIIKKSVNGKLLS